MISQSSRGSCSVLQLQYLTKLDGQVQCAGLCHATFAQTRALPESCDALSQSSNAVSKNWIPLNSASFPHFWSGNYCPLSYQNYSLSGRIPWREGRGEMSSQRRGVRRCSRHIGLCSCDRMGKVCRWQNWLRQKAGSRSFWENAVLNSGLQFGLLPQTVTRSILYCLLLTSLFCHPVVIQLPPAAQTHTSAAVSVFYVQIELVKTFQYILPSHRNHNFPEGKMVCCGNSVLRRPCCRHTDQAVLRWGASSPCCSPTLIVSREQIKGNTVWARAGEFLPIWLSRGEVSVLCTPGPENCQCHLPAWPWQHREPSDCAAALHLGSSLHGQIVRGQGEN